mgnify:CR=1 FL=1
MAKSLHARLVAYRPFGARIGILAMPVSFSASILHNDDGAISIEYSLLSGDAQAFDRKLTDSKSPWKYPTAQDTSNRTTHAT